MGTTLRAKRTYSAPAHKRPMALLYAGAVLVLALLAAVALWLTRPQPSASILSANRDNVKGSPTAPIVVEEWSDYG